MTFCDRYKECVDEHWAVMMIKVVVAKMMKEKFSVFVSPSSLLDQKFYCSDCFSKE